MKKYLFYFGYIGTRFRGVQKDKLLGNADYCVTKYLEDGLLALSPLNTPIVYNSSRTDQGVHAICSTFHSELVLPPIRGLRSNKDKEDYITFKLNNFFEKYFLNIRIQKTQAVPIDFHCRHSAKLRTYLYRLIQVPKDLKIQDLPILELNRCQIIRGDFDIEAIRSACSILKGHHDFRYFSKFTKDEDSNKSTERIIEELKIVPGTSYLNSDYDEGYENLHFWDVIVSSQSFLRTQVRRMVGLLICVGKKRASLRDVKSTILYPARKWDPRFQVAGANGLYLLNIEYPPEAFLETTYHNRPKI